MNFLNHKERLTEAFQRGPSVIRTGGFTIVETLVYMAVLFLIVGLAYTATDKSMDASTALRHNANDISQTLKIGELWRDDVRDATRPIRMENSGQEIILRVPQKKIEVDYRFSTNAVSRRIGRGGWSVLLDHVKDSAFVADKREKVKAWRWELELQPNRKRITRVRPLFTFIAVPSAPSAR